MEDHRSPIRPPQVLPAPARPGRSSRRGISPAVGGRPTAPSPAPGPAVRRGTPGPSLPALDDPAVGLYSSFAPDGVFPAALAPYSRPSSRLGPMASTLVSEAAVGERYWRRARNDDDHERYAGTIDALRRARPGSLSKRHVVSTPPLVAPHAHFPGRPMTPASSAIPALLDDGPYVDVTVTCGAGVVDPGAPSVAYTAPVLRGVTPVPGNPVHFAAPRPTSADGPGPSSADTPSRASTQQRGSSPCDADRPGVAFRIAGGERRGSGELSADAREAMHLLARPDSSAVRAVRPNADFVAAVRSGAGNARKLSSMLCRDGPRLPAPTAAHQPPRALRRYEC